ncbi:hypothetical protein L195_g037705 [Trifolium pratense]|uniref:Uncharacterized protein n=1 Tax=Trifolium pratense TaxID=57577 RepID=A0A2K3JM46_TRIPR|nr:hypothetical protein L195_g048725 [Trifolium pratense]PNX81585.1 hypothetical protein L195_g037608 [Trifolium pratense]PNX81681.1 hypothetical protein L195_g037705 [Trifolium pratense]
MNIFGAKMAKEESPNRKSERCEEMHIGTNMRILESKKGYRDKALPVPKAHQRREDDRFH